MKQVLSQAGEMRPSQEWGCLTALMEKKFPKFEEWYANANDIVAFFFISGQKSGENHHEHTFMHHYHHPISIVFPLQLPNTLYSMVFSLSKQANLYYFPSTATTITCILICKAQSKNVSHFQKSKKRNLEPILSVLMHSLIKFKCKRNSIEPGLPGLPGL